jgi:hypothetical protein
MSHAPAAAERAGPAQTPEVKPARGVPLHAVDCLPPASTLSDGDPPVVFLGHLARRPPEHRASALGALSRTSGNRAVQAMIRRVGAEQTAGSFTSARGARSPAGFASSMLSHALFGPPPTDGGLRFSHRLDPAERDATEPRLVGWAVESGTEDLLIHANLVELQLKPGTESSLVADAGSILARKIRGSREFEGSEEAREEGVATLLDHWDAEVRPTLEARLAKWFAAEYIAAVRRTPSDASLVSKPDEYWRIRNAPFFHWFGVGRWRETAKVGSRWGPWVIADVFNFGPWATVWISLADHPDWYYVMSDTAFIRADPLVSEVARQVADKTKYAGEIMPGILTIAGFTLGLSARVAFIIASIALEELAEEMRRETRGERQRSASEIATTAVQSYLLSRIFGKLFGAEGGTVAKAAPEAELIVERAVPAVQREVAESEGPAVAAALRSGEGRAVTDPAMRAEGYVIEVEVVTEGRRHVYRKGPGGTWCRYSKRVCGLDLGAEVAEAAKSPTERELEHVRGTLRTVSEELDALRRIWLRMKDRGRMDTSLLDPAERELLDNLSPRGDAGDLSLAQLRDLPREAELSAEPGLLAARERELIKQLWLESRDLYTVMRAASPSEAVRRRVLRESRGLDAVTGASPKRGGLEVDHVVPVDTIVGMPEFRDLRLADQLAVVNDVKNLRAICRVANASRQHRSWREWPQALTYYDVAELTKMRALEDELSAYLTQRIAALRRRR